MDGEEPIGPASLGQIATAFTWSPDGASLLSIDSTTIKRVDADLARPPTTLVDLTTSAPSNPNVPSIYIADIEGCGPSWQRIDPS